MTIGYRPGFTPALAILSEDSNGVPPVASPGGHPIYYQKFVASQTVLQNTVGTVFVDTPLASGESTILVALIEIGQVGSLGVGGNITLKATVENVNGTLTNTVTGSTSTLYVDISSPAGANINSALSGASAAVVASGTGLAIQVTAPSGVSIWARGNVDVTRARRPTMQVLSASPAQGLAAGGTTVTLAGEGFTGAVAVYLLPAGTNSNVNIVHGLTASGVSVASNSSMSFVTPLAQTVGAYNVQVVRSDGSSAVLPSGFSYANATVPTVTSVVPDAGTAGASTTFTITGTGFVGATSVTVGGSAASITGNTGTVLTVTGPAGLTASATAVGISVTTPGGTGSKASCVTVLPAGLLYNWDASAGLTVNGASSTLTDFQGGKTMTVGGSQTAPSSTSNYNGSGLTAASFPSGAAGMTATINTTAQPVTHCWIGDSNPPTNQAGTIFGDNTESSPFLYANNNLGTKQIRIGSAATEVNLTPQAVTSPTHLDAIYNGASSAIWLNGASAITGNAGANGNSASKTVQLGSSSAGGSQQTGNTGQVLVFSGALGSPSLAIISSYIANKWKTAG